MVRNCNATAFQGTVAQPIINLLLIEDNLAEARLLQEFLRGTILNRVNLAHAKRLGEAIEHLRSEMFDVILLDLTLPDSQGLASLDALIHRAPRLPIVVLTNTNDDDLALQAVRHGAQDYLVKRQINQDSLVRSLRYAIERKQGAEALREANEILEQRVQERTAELETANELLRQEIEWRQRIQERLELAQQAGKIGTFEWAIQSNAITWTAELEVLYGVAPGALDGRYHNWLRMIHPDDRVRIEQELTQAIATRRGLNTEFRIVQPTGDVRWIAAKSSIFDDLNGHPLRMLGVHIDITDKKQLEAQFLHAQRLESLGTLASGIAHDLNNILTPMLAVVQLLPLKVPNLNEQSRHLLKTLESSAHRGAELVKQILSFARGIEGKRVSLQVGHLLSEVEKIIQQTLPKSITIQLDVEPDLWTIAGDMTQLHQVFMNLCVNARDSMPTGGTLQIAAQNQILDETFAQAHLDAQPGAYIVVAITDTGTGIAPEILHRIFDPFFTTKEVGKGTGLGLSAVLGIVKSHDGFIDVHSTMGQGSQFTVYLPASQTPCEPSPDTIELQSGQQELILIVDDETAICEITKTTLEAYNYQVLTAKDGIEAIALFAAHSDEIQTVLMDIMMPTMDGLATISLLRQCNPAVRTVAMSGLSTAEAIAQAQKMGFQDFLPKPFSTQALLQVLAGDG